MAKQNKRKFDLKLAMNFYWNYSIAAIAGLVSGFAIYQLTKFDYTSALGGIFVLIFALLVVGIGLQMMVNSRKD